jgi:hypothetical protein
MLDGESVLQSIATRLAGIVKTSTRALQRPSCELAASGIERIARCKAYRQLLGQFALRQSGPDQVTPIWCRHWG